MYCLVRVFIDPVSTAPTHVLLVEQNFQMVPKLYFCAFKLQKYVVFKIIEQVAVLKMVATQSLIKVFIDPVSTAPTHVLLAEQNFQMVLKLHF